MASKRPKSIRIDQLLYIALENIRSKMEGYGTSTQPSMTRLVNSVLQSYADNYVPPSNL
jgi:hypothetical protein